MPAGIRFRAAEMSKRFLFLFCSHVRSLAGIEADENNFVVAPRIEREHAQYADDALFDLIAKHGTTVVNEGENHRPLPEILAESNLTAGFVAESEVQGHLAIERRFGSGVLPSTRQSRRPWARAAGNPPRAQPTA